MNNNKKLIAVVGPTASGKSDLAVFLAQKIDGEIISADSRQVYKWMDIGTGKVTKKEMGGIPHYLLNIAHPSRQFTVAEFKKKTEKIISKIYKNNKIPILVGGTGFYINAVLYDINFPAVSANKKLRKTLDKYSAKDLYAMLKKKDPTRAKTIEQKNKRRLIRALEIIETTGAPVPILAPPGGAKMGKLPYDFLIIGIKVPKEKLYERIKKRLDVRFNPPTGGGMILEVTRLHEKHGVSWKRLENFGLEYRWIAKYLQKKISHPEMEEKLYSDIKGYARRQMTWFKRMDSTSSPLGKRIHWINLENKKQLQKEAYDIVKKWLRS